ncbi:MAG: Dna2/Cas4 domain-containing protein [Bacteroidetes bacterium]|nr:Dna2/Cas4 domain-containing protein [Bacteroidota bacterium]
MKTSFTSDEIIIGNLIHETISYVHTKEDIPKIINTILSKNGNQGFRKFTETVSQQVHAIWTLLEGRGWTSTSFEIVNECDLCDERGMLHRPDRVLIHGDTGIVIDFKTGKKDEKYHQQVKEYCRLLESTGISNLTGYLLYTTEKEIVKVV